MVQSPVARNNRFTVLAVAAVLLTALLTGVGQGPVSADVTAVRGSAYGSSANVSIFGGAFNERPPTPTVTLPPGGSVVPITATAPTGTVAYGPAYIFTSGPVTVTTQGTTGPAGSVTSTATMQNVNRFGVEVFTAANLSSTCTASEAGVSGSTTVLNGTVLVADPDQETSGEEGEVVVNVPLNPEPNTTYEGRITTVGDDFEYVFNEQIVNPDGSLTAYAAHLRLLGPTAIGDLYVGKSECGVTSDSTTTTTQGPTTTTTQAPTTTTTQAPTTTTTQAPTTTTTTILEGDICDGLAATMVGTEGPDRINGTQGDDVIMGLGGDDVIDGRGGDDVICGGDGNDGIGGDIGDDRLFGEAGNDQIRGQDGADHIEGADGDDNLDGGNDNDLIEVGSGNNLAAGGPGNDTFVIRVESFDRIRGEGGDDFVAGFGDDFGSLREGEWFDGGDGNDWLNAFLAGGTYFAGAGDDRLTRMEAGTYYGGAGNDSVNGFRAAGTFYGGEGNDTAVGPTGSGTFYGGPGDDRGSVAGTSTFFGGEGNDLASSTSGTGLYCGGVGNDVASILLGGTFYGEEGVDQAGLLLPGAVFVQDGECPVEEIPSRFS